MKNSLILVIASLLVSIALAELILWIIGFSFPAWYVPDYHIGWKHQPNMEGFWTSEGNAHVRVNAEGFRDIDRSTTKPDGTIRIAVLGDSYANALQVDIEDTFWRRLEGYLGNCPMFSSANVEVLNFGISGFGTFQELLTYRHYAKKYDPDIVLLAMVVQNDVRNNSMTLEPRKHRPFPVFANNHIVSDVSFRESAKYKRRTSVLYKAYRELHFLRTIQALSAIRAAIRESRLTDSPNATNRKTGDEPGLNDQVFLEPINIDWKAAWLLTEAVIAQLRDEVSSAGRKLFIATLSSGIQVHPNPKIRQDFVDRLGVFDLTYPDRRISALAETLGVQHINVAGAMAMIAERDQIHFHGFENTAMGIGHWNRDGHRIGAKIIGAAMCGNFTP